MIIQQILLFIPLMTAYRGLTPVIELISEYQSLSMIQWGVFSLISQEVAQLRSGKHTTITWIVSKDGIQLGPPQQLSAELLGFCVIQAAIAGSVTPLEFKGGVWVNKDKQTNTHSQGNSQILNAVWICLGSASNSPRGKHFHTNSTQLCTL